MYEVITPVRDDAREFPSFDRGAHFLNAISGIGVTVQNQRVADLGAGYGSIAIACAKAGAAHVVAIDANPERVSEIAQRTTELGIVIKTAQANLLEPLSGFIDNPVQVAFLIGVVEYAGLWKSDEPVEVLQQRVFEHALQILNPGGVLVVATKNRLWPRYVFRDMHTKQPLVNALPRRVADLLSRKLRGTPYREHIQSPQDWKCLLLGAGFRKVTCYYPLFSYQFPLLVVEKPKLQHVRQLVGQSDALPAEVATSAFGRYRVPKALLMVLSSAVHVPLSSAVIIKAEK